MVVRAPKDRVFDLARSIDAHIDSTGGTGERAVAGVTRGLIGLNETVTWEARHLGVRQRLTVRITAMDRPDHFQDVMVAGAFHSMTHDHHFAEHPEGTLMTDRFEFRAPLGVLGWLAERLFFEDYMKRLLTQRNEVLRQLSESGDWARYLQTP